MTRKLPPIFARHRFAIPKADQPEVVFCVTPEMDREAQHHIDQMDRRDTPWDFFACWWVEYSDMGILAQILSDTEFQLKWFGRKTGAGKPFVFDTRLLDADTYSLTNVQKIAVASYIRGGLLLHLYTERERDVSVNTQTRNKPRAFARQGDTMRFAPLYSLASAAGQHRQRGYERPDDPSGIRMREHAVRGHWRTYASGARVWVRPHKRGDSDLGRVQRVVT